MKRINHGEHRKAQLARSREQALDTTTARLATTLQSAADCVLVTDVHGRVEFLNGAAERLTGIGSVAAEGRPLHDVLRLEERYGDAVTGNLVELAVLSEKTVALGKDLLLRADTGETTQVEGEIAVRTSGGGAATGAVVTFRDVTARNRDELQKREEHKMRAVAHLAGTVAHQLNNLLTVVMGNSEELDDMYPELAPLRKRTAAIQLASGDIAALTRQLLTLSRREVLQPTAVDLNTLINRSRAHLEGLLPADIDLTISLEPQLGTVLVDQAQMEQALFDCVRGARDRTPSGGTLELTTANVIMDENRRGCHLRRYVQLTIRDSGPALEGIAKEQLCEPSWNRDPGLAYSLGLFTIRNVASAASGHFSIESESGVGARFVLLLPQVDQDISVSSGGTAATDTQSPRTVLLVEDDNAIRILLRNSLERQGYHVLEARDGAEALLQAELHDETINLLITDVVMPVMNGPTLARHLGIARPETKLLLISGCPDELVEVQHLVQRGAHFMQKPFSQRDLLARVEAILSDR